MYNINIVSEGKICDILATLRTGLANLLGDQLEAVYLYGSHARGEATSDSDIDVLIVILDDFDYGEILDQNLNFVAYLSLEHDVVISRAITSKDRFKHEMSPFLMNVRREAVLA